MGITQSIERHNDVLPGNRIKKKIAEKPTKMRPISKWLVCTMLAKKTADIPMVRSNLWAFSTSIPKPSSRTPAKTSGINWETYQGRLETVSSTAIVTEAYTGSLGPVATGFRLDNISTANGLMTVTGRIK